MVLILTLHSAQLLRRHQESGVDTLHGIGRNTLDHQQPTSRWTREDDRQLLLATYRHGYSRVDDIRKDDTFSFSLEVSLSY